MFFPRSCFSRLGPCQRTSHKCLVTPSMIAGQGPPHDPPLVMMWWWGTQKIRGSWCLRKIGHLKMQGYPEILEDHDICKQKKTGTFEKIGGARKIFKIMILKTNGIFKKPRVVRNPGKTLTCEKIGHLKHSAPLPK